MHTYTPEITMIYRVRIVSMQIAQPTCNSYKLCDVNSYTYQGLERRTHQSIGGNIIVLHIVVCISFGRPKGY